MRSTCSQYEDSTSFASLPKEVDNLFELLEPDDDIYVVGSSRDLIPPHHVTFDYGSEGSKKPLVIHEGLILFSVLIRDVDIDVPLHIFDTFFT